MAEFYENPGSGNATALVTKKESSQKVKAPFRFPEVSQLHLVQTSAVEGLSMEVKQEMFQ